MRNLIISLAAAASALAVATPAAAQGYQQGYHYPQGPQGHAYGWHNSGQARALHARIDNIQRQIQHLDRRNILSEREARNLHEDSRQLERRLRAVRQNGLHPTERYDIERRLARLEQRLWRDVRDRDGRRWGNGYGNNGYSQYSYDRDRDGRDDRYEDDRGTRHD